MRSRIALLAIALVMACHTLVAWRWLWNGPPGRDWRTIVRSDVRGYHGYLHALLITHDLGHEQPNGEYIHVTPDGTLNKYFCGESVMLAPFFLGAHGVAALTGAPQDGSSAPYQKSISLAALVYTCIGLLALRRLLRGIGVNEGSVAVVVLALGLGTQLFQYSALQPGWTHAYSFCAMAVFLLLVLRAATSSNAWTLVAAGAVFGLVVLIRPVNGIVLLAVPVMLGDRTWPTIATWWARRGAFAAAVIAACAVIAIQPALWHMQTGHWLEWSYRGEGFYWSHPRIARVLFSFRRGLFLWTPVAIAFAACAVLLLRTDLRRAIWALVYWCAAIYVISAWWIWYYGGGFGLRPFIDHYPVLCIPFALVLTRAARGLRTALLVFTVLASGLHLAQFYQFNHGLLHSESMDRRKYAFAFLHFDAAHRDRLGGDDQEPPFSPNGLEEVMSDLWGTAYEGPHWSGRAIDSGDPAHGRVLAMDPGDEFGPSFVLHGDELPHGRELYLELSFLRRVDAVDDTRQLLGVTTVENDSGALAYYRSFRMEPLPPQPGRWERLAYRIPVPAIAPGQHLKFYFWSKTRSARCRIDDLEMHVLAVRPY